ncbi:MAG: hypothetical protein COA58_16720 [Bacteroidetes bacterium]|nr:MAG: hypothetical protein COA58_16720 [Bacteroidota bacterium]
MKKSPNNFPREGQHNTITRANLDSIEANRSKPNTELNYTIGGSVETQVHSNIEADRNYALTVGHKRFSELSQKLQTDHVFSANKGRAKAQFKAINDDTPTYAQMQRAAAAEAKAKRQEKATPAPVKQPDKAISPVAPVKQEPRQSYVRQQQANAAKAKARRRVRSR